jgi:hypothetical protein
MVRGVEDLRTPLSEIKALDIRLRGTLSGFMMPSFVIDLPGGGGKRLVSTHETYDEETGEATYRAPGLTGTKGSRTYTYYDPKPLTETELVDLRDEREKTKEMGKLLDNAEKQVVEIPVAKEPVVGTSLVAEPILETPMVKEPVVKAAAAGKPARQEESEQVPMPALRQDPGRGQREVTRIPWTHPVIRQQHESGAQASVFILGSGNEPGR